MTGGQRRGLANRCGRVALAVSVCVVVTLVSACRQPIEPIVVRGNNLVVTNTSKSTWLDVEVWVNHHYRVTVARLEPTGVLNVPLTSFVAGFGQRFDPARQRVSGVEVSARTPDGTPTSVTWGEGRIR